MLKKKFSLLLVAVSLLFTRSGAQLIDSINLDIYPAIQKLLIENKIPAVGIGIIKDNKLRQILVAGELKKGEPAPYNTIFNVASLTKPIVAMLTLKLVSSGQWNLDEPVAKYWTDPDISNDPRSKKITTRHILSHQTGFKNWRYLNDSQKLTIEFEPGSKFGYSGEGLEYLRIALEKKFKMSLAQLADSLIFKPYKMTDSRLVWDSNMDESRFAAWHDNKGEHTYPTTKRTEPNAADDLLTTIEDYGKFCEAVLNKTGISKSVYEEMVKPQATIGNNDYFGLGWEIFTLPASSKQFALIHTGGDRGVQTIAIICPLSGEGLIIFTNGDNGGNLYPVLMTNFLSIGKELIKVFN